MKLVIQLKFNRIKPTWILLVLYVILLVCIIGEIYKYGVECTRVSDRMCAECNAVSAMEVNVFQLYLSDSNLPKVSEYLCCKSRSNTFFFYSYNNYLFLRFVYVQVLE